MAVADLETRFRNILVTMQSHKDIAHRALQELTAAIGNTYLREEIMQSDALADLSMRAELLERVMQMEKDLLLYFWKMSPRPSGVSRE